MKYSELIDFQPIEDVIQLKSGDDPQKSRQYVRSYVMSDRMAAMLKSAVADQLQPENANSLGVLVVGNYGTGKSHLMSVIAAVANDAENLSLLTNRNFADAMEPVAGKYEVLRIEIEGSLTASLREIIFAYIRENFAARGIFIDEPDFDKVYDNKRLIQEIMNAFAKKYPARGFLIVVDEFFSYMSSRNSQELIRDAEFLRSLSEMCSRSALRIILGVQEKIFDNPRFSFVSDTLSHVKDRFTQVIITKDATGYVVSERILKKSPAQKNFIRQHLEKFCSLYDGMSSRLDDFVNLFPIHPAYIDVFDKIYLIENRHVLKSISLAIKNIFDDAVPDDAPGIISFDDYWPTVKSDIFPKNHDETIRRVVEASGKLENIINRSFRKTVYKPLAIKIIYALSVHRLTTGGLDLRYGLTAENLRDDLCLYLPLPEKDANFLLGVVRQTLDDIIQTVSGQFIIRNEDNGQFYIDVDKTIDYDENIRQKASFAPPDELNQNFYRLVLDALKWEKQPYVPNFKIYEHDLTWQSKNIFRKGYLFLGLPEDRSTAQPERDFYVHFMPPFTEYTAPAKILDDEIYFHFKPEDDFKKNLALYAAARELERMSTGKDRAAYQSRADALHKKFIRYLDENKINNFDIVYRGKRRHLFEILRGRSRPDDTFGDTLDLAAAICLENYFQSKYPDFPAMKIKVTQNNWRALTTAALGYFNGKKTRQAADMLRSFDLLDGDEVRPERSPYAKYFIDLVNSCAPKVLNYSDLFEGEGDAVVDKHFKIPFTLTPIIFVALVYGGFAEITFEGGSKLTAGNLDPRLQSINFADLLTFQYLSRPAKMPLAALKKLFQIINLDSEQILDPNRQSDAVQKLVERAKKLCNDAARYSSILSGNFFLWGEPLVTGDKLREMKSACSKIRDEFGNYGVRFNTPAKLNNFNLTDEQLDELAKNLKLLNFVKEFVEFRTGCAEAVAYAAAIERVPAIEEDLEEVNRNFRVQRQLILSNVKGSAAAQKVCDDIAKFKGRYIELYLHRHADNRLNRNDDARKGKIVSGQEISNLRNLSRIGIFPTAQFNELQRDLSDLQTCFELTREELDKHPTCPHCHYRLSDTPVDVHEQLDRLETLPEKILREWQKILLDTLNDPILESNMEYLHERQRVAIQNFISDEELPRYVNEFFVTSIKELLKTYQPVVIDADELIRELEILPPLDEKTFRAKILEFISRRTAGKDPSTVRVSLKRR